MPDCNTPPPISKTHRQPITTISAKGSVWTVYVSTAKTTKSKSAKLTHFQVLQNLINWRNKTHRQPITKIGAKMRHVISKSIAETEIDEEQPMFQIPISVPTEAHNLTWTTTDSLNPSPIHHHNHNQCKSATENSSVYNESTAKTTE